MTNQESGKKGCRGGGCLLGCGIGCLVIIILLVGGAGVLYFMFGKPIATSLANTAQLEKEASGKRQELVTLDKTYPYAGPQDPATLDLTDQDLDRYIAVRAALEGALSRMAEREQGGIARLSPGESPGFGVLFKMFTGMFQDMEQWSRARLGLLETAWGALNDQKMGPRELGVLAGIVEWRFLGREEAAYLGLEDGAAESLWKKERSLRMQEGMLALGKIEGVRMDPKARAELERRIQDLHEEIQGLKDQAARNTAISRNSRALLERRKTELQGFSADGDRWLGTLTWGVDPLAEAMDIFQTMGLPAPRPETEGGED